MNKQIIREAILKNFIYDSESDNAQMFDGVWYTPLWGCDTLDHIMDSISNALDQLASADKKELEDALAVEPKSTMTEECSNPDCRLCHQNHSTE